MTLYSVVTKIPSQDIVTVANYIDGGIIVDCESVENLLNSKRWHKELKSLVVYGLEVGKVFGDLIISVCEN